MKSRVKVEVVQRDIEWGIKDDSSRCVVARAIARQFPDSTRIEVDTQTIRCTSEGKRWVWLTPLVVQNYVAQFDDGADLQPFAFTLSNPIHVRRRLTREESKAHKARVGRENYRRARRKAERHGNVTDPADPAAPQTLVGNTAPGRYAGITSEVVNPEARQAPPRVFKDKKRTYGARRLRINNPKVEPGATVPQIDPRVRSVVKILDDLLIPNAAGYDRCREALLLANADEARHVVRLAIKIRKSRGNEDI